MEVFVNAEKFDSVLSFDDVINKSDDVITFTLKDVFVNDQINYHLAYFRGLRFVWSRIAVKCKGWVDQIIIMKRIQPLPPDKVNLRIV